MLSLSDGSETVVYCTCIRATFRQGRTYFGMHVSLHTSMLFERFIVGDEHSIFRVLKLARVLPYRELQGLASGRPYFPFPQPRHSGSFYPPPVLHALPDIPPAPTQLS